MGNTQPRRLEEYLAQESLLILGMLLLALVQVTLLPTPLGFPPALLLVVVVCRTLVRDEGSYFSSGLAGAVRWAFYGGIALDIFAATPLGSHALALLLAAILVAAGTYQLRVEGPLLPLLSVLAGTIVYELVLAVVCCGTMIVTDWRSYAVVVIMPSVLLALIPTLPIFLLLRWLSRDGNV